MRGYNVAKLSLRGGRSADTRCKMVHAQSLGYAGPQAKRTPQSQNHGKLERCGSNPSPAGAAGGWPQLYDNLSVDRPPTGLQHALLLIPRSFPVEAKFLPRRGTLWEGNFFRCLRAKSDANRLPQLPTSIAI